MTDMITIPRADYDSLIERLEDLEDALIADQRRNEETVPFSVAERIIDGAHPVTVWREERGLTQRALAERANLSPSMLNEIERGKRSPSLATARAIATALRLGLDDLFGNDDSTISESQEASIVNQTSETDKQ